jgi:hypothetical protein
LAFKRHPTRAARWTGKLYSRVRNAITPTIPESKDALRKEFVSLIGWFDEHGPKSDAAILRERRL